MLEVDETYRAEVACGRLNPQEWLSWPKQEVLLASPLGYPLFGVYLPLPGAAQTVIILHGITYSLFGSVKYAALFRQFGFNVLLYDHRNHGRSGGRWSTFGWYEKRDLGVWVNWARQQLPENGKIAALGESFGAAVMLGYAAEQAGLNFLVSDCCFSDLNALLAHRLKVEYGLPAFPFLPLASLCAWALTGFHFGQASPLRDVTKIEAPVLFAHGQDDSFTPCWMSEALYRAKKNGPRAIYLAPRADHAEALWKDPAAYQAQLRRFLAAQGVIPPV